MLSYIFLYLYNLTKTELYVGITLESLIAMDTVFFLFINVNG